MQAAMGEVDVTPPVGTHKIGWLVEQVGEQVADPLYGRVCVLASGGERIAFVQLDTLSVSRKQVAEIRRLVQEKFGFPGGNVMVAATHNHAGPALIRIGDEKPDAAYVESLTTRIVACFGDTLKRLVDVEIGTSRKAHFAISHNRRVVMRDGTATTHGSFQSSDALYVEGPTDPELFVLAVRAKSTGKPLGCLVNYTCHPTDHGYGPVFSAGWPGVLADELKRAGYPVPMFLQGALGNVSSGQPHRGGGPSNMTETGKLLAADAIEALNSAQYRSDAKLGSRSTRVELPFRQVTDDEVRGTVRGAQRFVDPSVYERGMPALLREIQTKRTQQAEVQVVFIDEYAFAAIPAELFVELGLRIKQQSNPRKAIVVGIANGMVGYAPTREAFARGGYETTFIASSKLAPEAGEMLADAAIRLIKHGHD